LTPAASTPASIPTKPAEKRARSTPTDTYMDL
jgi:hypothetical protein